MSDDDGFVQRRWSEKYWTGLIKRTYREVLPTAEPEQACGTVSTIQFYSRVKVDDFATVTLGKWGGYYIQIIPSVHTNRLVLTPMTGNRVYAHGWCFDRGPAAALAALAWDPQRQAEPHGYKIRIGPRRLAGEQASRVRPKG